MSEDRKFVRVFYNDLIQDYPEMWADDHQLATWLRMLATADPMWPTPPEVARSVRPAVLAKLVDTSLIQVVGDRYRVKGLDAVRGKVADAARNAAAVRWQSARNAEAMPTKPDADQTRPDAYAARAEDDEDPADIYWRLTGKYPNEKVLPWIDQLINQYGARAVTTALVTAHIEDKATMTLLGRTQDRLRAEARQLDRKELAEEKARLAEKRAQPRQLEQWQIEYRKALEEQYRGAA